MFILGFILFLLVTCYPAIINGASLFDFLSTLIVLVGILSVVIMTGTFRDCIYGFKLAIRSKKAEYKELNVDRSINALDFLFKISIAIGFIESLVGIISISMLLKDLSDLGPNLATALIAVLYGLIIAFVIVLPAKQKLQLLKIEHNRTNI